MNPTLNREEAVAALKVWATEHRDTLLKQGVHSIEGCYSGSGDEGQFDSVEAVKDDGMPADYDVPARIEKLLEDLFEEAADSGFQDNDGGGGRLIIEIETGRVLHTSYYNVTVQQDCGDEEL